MMPPTTTIIGQDCGLQTKPVKVTKVRRSRQPKNPQLSVARRNERERNRVKMVNNGFALLREHLPIEDLQECCESGSDTPAPEGQRKAKKYSKVETLRAAIQRIRMLEELIRSTEPGFESMNIMPSSNANSYDDEPLSCSSSASPATTTTMTSSSATQANMYSSMPIESNNQCQQVAPAASSQHQLYATNQQGQFIKLEPSAASNNYYSNHLNQMPSPQDSQTSTASGLSHNNNHQHQHQHQQTQVHHQQPQYSFHVNNQAESVPSHTHLWIQQHQNSFMEQRQQTADWYQQQQQQQQPFQAQQLESPEVQQIQQHQQSPVWFGSSQSPSSQHSQPAATFVGHQQHQISLYSQ